MVVYVGQDHLFDPRVVSSILVEERGVHYAFLTGPSMPVEELVQWGSEATIRGISWPK